MADVLFVQHRAGYGGVSVSLASWLSLLAEAGICADVMLMQHDGELTDLLRESGRLLPEDPVLSAISMTRHQLRARRAWGKLLLAALFRALGAVLGNRRVHAFIKRRRAARLSGRYRAVIAYQEGIATRFAADIGAARHIGWVHSNPEAFEHESPMSLYDGYDAIVCVSDVAREAMRERLGPQRDIRRVHNPMPVDRIRRMAREAQDDVRRTARWVLVSVGRMAEAKRFDRAVDAAAILHAAGVDFVWYIIGDGALRADIQARAEAAGISDRVHLPGARANPYARMAAADLVVVTSDFEANPLVVSEALVLGRPVLTTGYPSAAEVVRDGENGLICPMDAPGVAQGILAFTREDSLRARLDRGAGAFAYDNATLLTQIKELLR